MSEKELQTITSDEVGDLPPGVVLAPETEAEPQPKPKYDPNDPEFRKAVMAVVLDMERRRSLR
ncbi:hypothetical protein REJC140_00104 [Pseudorhizobium endolithicum]|uniref:Transposase n=1 Tax=Pseudorhizobium endolithicum TaxID=1191678 RepID=A0ABN7JEN7_9HYPH|nr:hypothetical protein [Pseudorhizobium endolithicum]CAD7023133.1 hypothetical protein REJC140_00104 [Pseudorhizobium endolithicum]